MKPAEPIKRAVSEKSHAGLMKGRATIDHAKGKISDAEKANIHAKANRMIGHTFHTTKG